ncbi:hypothetical protein H6F86_03040 [Phormidium sp. FACHB-592]|uniref:GUN4-like domain-containing protein n=1 Tax=Stenomitos frigidus AS-A4 TaxID=2933935 RepID=A0ABV0KNX1_9CYAN|nr:hypothetical protein [Phormidium sp. FACHB-592]MBD2072877.1 hypothetical protein [Phormidium sp. FACHB-592]
MPQRSHAPRSQKSDKDDQTSLQHQAVVSSGGRTMPAPLRTHMESAFNASFANVKIHEGNHVGAVGAITISPIQRAIIPSPAAPGIDVEQLKKDIQTQRMEILKLQKTPKGQMSSTGGQLEICLRRLYRFFEDLLNPDKLVQQSLKEFITWKKGDGVEAWGAYRALSDELKPKERSEGADTKPTFSRECEAVFRDMEDQFSRWNGTKTKRGAYWGSAAPGLTTGAKAVSSGIIQELRRKANAAGGNWRFSDSWSGGLSFHRSRGGIDFIYHMLPSR